VGRALADPQDQPPTYLFPMVRERSEAKDDGISDGATPVYAAAMTLGK